MEAVSIEGILRSYQLLSDPSAEVRQRANLYLYSLIDRQQVWAIANEMIVGQSVADYQLLGAQILYQKVQRDIGELSGGQLRELKQFLMRQLGEQRFSLAVVRKLGGAAGLVLGVLVGEGEGGCVGELVAFMERSPLQLRNGLVVLERLPEELRENNRIKHGVKAQVREKLLESADLLCRVYCSAILLEQAGLIELALEGLESWISVGFPFMRYTELVRLAVRLLGAAGEAYLEGCCRIIKEALQHAAREKFQSISESEFSIEREKYSSAQMESLGVVVGYLRGTKPAMYGAIAGGSNLEQIEIYTLIIKEMLLSYGFLLREEVGYELIEMLFKALEGDDLRLSYSTFQFWIQFCDRIEKMRVQAELELRFWQIVEHLLDVILGKTMLDNDTLMYEMLKEEDTVDDLNRISISEYRKEAQHIVRFAFDFFSAKRGREGSLLFFGKLLAVVNGLKAKGQVGRGVELAIYAVKSALESMVRDYDTKNVVDFIEFVMAEVEAMGQVPNRLTAEVLNLLKDCNRQVKEKEGLFLRSLAYCLRFVCDDMVGHYAVYAFQSLMESINEISNDALVNDLLNFYGTTQFAKESVLQKVLEGILSSVAKLTNREAIGHYLGRIVQGVQSKNMALLSSQGQNSYVSLVEIKTLLDSFDHFRAVDQEYFRPTFLRISTYGIAITTRIVQTHISQRIKFSAVGELGASLSLLRNSLKICENVKLQEVPVGQYVSLLTVVLQILQPGRLELFNEYNGLLEVVCKVLTQFVGERVGELDGWIGGALPGVNSFFLGQVQQLTMASVDPDLLKWYFSIQESVLIYSRQLYLLQPQHLQIYELALASVQFINERGLQRKAVSFLYQCVQMRDVYAAQTEATIKVIFSSIPIVNSVCHITLGRILVVLLEKVDLKAKENVFRQLLEYEPYCGVQRDLKEIVGRLIAFAVESKVERYLKGAIGDLSDVRWKQAGADLALHLQLRFASWRKEYNKMLKSGVEPK